MIIIDGRYSPVTGQSRYYRPWFHHFTKSL